MAIFYGYDIDMKRLPTHIGIIMDGNGRWAKKRKLHRLAGHERGFSTLKKIITANKTLGVEYISVYAFSTENWKRPLHEVKFLMKMAAKMLSQYVDTLIKNDIRLMVTGAYDKVSVKLVNMVEDALEKTKECKSYVLNVAFNYGGRNEIVDAVKKMVNEEKNILEDLDEALFSKYLYNPELPDVDLIIRTSGEKRLSNFLLWQSAYSEFWFTKKLWPDFTPKDYFKAVYDFQQRKRRFGSV